MPASASPARAQIMGILNVTPDSFSDGGSLSNDAAISEQVQGMLAAGVDIIDVGGESTRPFAEPVELDEELARVLPAIKAIRACDKNIPVSIDTTKAEVARHALDCGATIINDISALRFDPEMISVALTYKVPVIIMHMQGTPGNMQLEPRYDDVVKEIQDFLEERISWASSQGLRRDQIIVDPGIGFGKSLGHNLSILKHVADFKSLGCRVLIGHSRKSFMGKLLDLEVEQRDLATASVSALCAMAGADIIRVHDVTGNLHAVRLAEAIREAL